MPFLSFLFETENRFYSEMKFQSWIKLPHSNSNIYFLRENEIWNCHYISSGN